jgi:BMFP domain-containing protein YqiC
MQTKNKFLDDISQIMNSAVGVAQGARDEAQNALKSVVDRMLADRNLVTREEFEAVRAMAQKAREENDALAARLVALEGLMTSTSGREAGGPSQAPTTPSL